MMAMVSAAAARVGESAFGRAWRKTADVLDCVIPIALAAVLAAGMALVLFDFVQ
jgi:hypothetical protein